MWVVEAAPRTLVSEEMLDQVRSGGGRPEVTLEGDMLKVRARNRTLIYRIGEYLPERHAYVAEWPD